MSYLVLARKWRPKRFAELVGQEHVVRALTNALASGRVHHAFLFTGTRGVGKTTIARIFAKSLNCERGTSADPCGECETCLAIDAGRYIDLLEIDAASNTGVDNVRELIDNAQYMPSRGRYKVYLIDEVHMLSKAAFNALLKTLEEPPGHVKFLFATTDPEKLLVTVLSRCLQFNLKRLDEQQIGGQITRILEAEQIPADAGAIRQIAKAADGSMRDGLSLLDQAIGYAGGELSDAAVAAMLGTVDRARVGALLQSLSDGAGAVLLQEVAVLAEFSPDWAHVLDALSEALHRIQVRQLVPEATVDADGVDVDSLAQQLRPEVVQLWYQMALHGRRDLALAPSPRAGFEMTLLRMLAFRPGSDAGDSVRAVPASRGDAAARAAAALGAATAPAAESAPRSIRAASIPSPSAPFEPVTPAPKRDPVVPPPPPIPAHVVPVESARPAAPEQPKPAPTEQRVAPAAPASASPANTIFDAPPVDPIEAAASRTFSANGRGIEDADDWHRFVASTQLKGPAKILAEHAGFVAYREGVLMLSLTAEEEHLRSAVMVKMVADALAPALGVTPQVRFESATAAPAESLRERKERARDERQAAAEAAFMGDPDVQRLISQHGAKIVPDSIRPFDEG